MALRKNPQTDVVADSSAADDQIRITHMLGDSDLKRYLRMSFHGNGGSVDQMRDVAAFHLNRIGIKPDFSKAVDALPEGGSDNYNLQSIYAWMGKLDKTHKKAIAQLQTLHATACRRLGNQYSTSAIGNDEFLRNNEGAFVSKDGLLRNRDGSLVDNDKLLRRNDGGPRDKDGALIGNDTLREDDGSLKQDLTRNPDGSLNTDGSTVNDGGFPKSNQPSSKGNRSSLGNEVN